MKNLQLGPPSLECATVNIRIAEEVAPFVLGDDSNGSIRGIHAKAEGSASDLILEYQNSKSIIGSCQNGEDVWIF